MERTQELSKYQTDRPAGLRHTLLAIENFLGSAKHKLKKSVF